MKRCFAIVFIVSYVLSQYLAGMDWGGIDPGGKMSEFIRITPKENIIKIHTGCKSLFKAAQRNCVTCCLKLLEEGHNPHERISKYGGATPLHRAAFREGFDVAKLLIEHGADVNAKKNNGETPLQLALMRQNSAMVELLINNKANIYIVTDDGDTTLHMAAQYDDYTSAKLLIEGYKATSKELPFVASEFIDKRNCASLTPLHYAALSNALNVVELLLINGADVNAKSQKCIKGGLVYIGSRAIDLTTNKYVEQLLMEYMRKDK